MASRLSIPPTDDVEKAESLIERGMLRRAERILKKLLSSDRNSISAHFNLVRVYIRTGQFELAVRHGRRVIRLNPIEWNAHLNLGLAYELKGQLRLASRHYHLELARNPKSMETLWNLGEFYLRKRQWRRATRAFQECLSLGYTFRFDDTVYKLGVAYQKIGNVRGYISLFNDYLDKNPGESWAWVNLGRALFHDGQPEEALAAFAKATELGACADVENDVFHAKRLLARKCKRQAQSGNRTSCEAEPGVHAEY